jgi:hypothetical protein
MSYRVLRSCAVHGHNFWVAHSSPSFGGRYFCTGYLRDDLFCDFDPRPYRDGEDNLDQTVRMIRGGWPTEDTPMVVLERHGGLLTVRPLGMRSQVPVTVHLTECWPNRHVPPSRNKCWE